MCLRLSCPVGAFHYLGFRTPKPHSFDPSFLDGHEEAFANHQAPRLGIPNGRLVLWFSKLKHREAGSGALGYFFRCAPRPNGCRFVDYVLNIVNVDRVVRVVEAPGDDVEGVTELPGRPESPPVPKLKVHFRLSRTIQATATPLEGNQASAEQSVESPEARPQPSMATPTEEDTRPKVLIRGEWRKVPDGYPTDASGELERDQLFINDPSKQLVAELLAACQFNPRPGAKPKSNDTKTALIYKGALCNYL